MYDKPMLSLEQAQAAITAMIADHNKDSSRRNVDMAVVDDAGKLGLHRIERGIIGALADEASFRDGFEEFE